ncbi:hypothetical protein ACFE04_018614 [Oxalis oulophora]
MEKVYVAIGDDLQDGYKTLLWTLNKWIKSISIVILHVNHHHHTSNDFVNSLYGKVPASVVSDEQLQAISFHEQQKTDQLLSKYLAFCNKAKVKAEILKVENRDEQIHKLMIDLISRLRITKLVLAITFMKQSSWQKKNGISGSFKVHMHKPEFCELYIVCGGKLLLRREENDNKGAIIMRQKAKPKRWLTRKFAEIVGKSHDSSAPNMNLREPENEWENHVREIQTYFQHLMSLSLNDDLEMSSLDPTVLRVADSNMDIAENMESKIVEANQKIILNRDAAKAHSVRSRKAERVVFLCNRRVEELESRIKEEVNIRMDLSKHFETEKEQIEEMKSDVDESKSRLRSFLQLETELSNKLKSITMKKSQANAQIERTNLTRAEMVREMGDLKRQREILHRRIEFCKEKDSIRMEMRLSEVSCGCRVYTAEEIKLATDGFSEKLRVKSHGEWTNVYKGHLHHITVAIKFLNSDSELSPQAFQAKVERLNDIRHPHFVAMIGFCSELKCIVYEYMHNGCIKEMLFHSQRNFRRTLRWNDRIRVAHEVCSGLTYLHLAEPRPIVHGHLSPSHILLDKNFHAKISGFGLNHCDLRSDVKSFGILLWNLLSGRNWVGIMEEVTTTDRTLLPKVLDVMAGQWPLDLAEELAEIAMKCILTDTELKIQEIMKDLEVMKKKAGGQFAKGVSIRRPVVDNREDSNTVPSVFLCPIFKEVMKNPCIAGDGFSYELEAIEEWLQMGNDTSPMTNLKLKHKHLTPNLTLRSLILDWHSKRSIPC